MHLTMIHLSDSFDNKYKFLQKKDKQCIKQLLIAVIAHHWKFSLLNDFQIMFKNRSSMSHFSNELSSGIKKRWNVDELYTL